MIAAFLGCRAQCFLDNSSIVHHNSAMTTKPQASPPPGMNELAAVLLSVMKQCECPCPQVAGPGMSSTNGKPLHMGSSSTMQLHLTILLARMYLSTYICLPVCLHVPVYILIHVWSMYLYMHTMHTFLYRYIYRGGDHILYMCVYSAQAA